MIIRFFFFNLLIWWITLIDFWMSNQSCILEINPTQSCYIIYCCNWFANILLRVFLSKIKRDILPFSFLSFFVFVWFWYQCNSGLIKLVGKCSSVFWKKLYKICVHSSNICENLPVKPSGPEDFYFGNLTMINSLSLMVIQLSGYLGYLFHLSWDLVVCGFWEI